MVMMYQSTVHQLLFNMTYEQTEDIIIKAQEFVDTLKGETNGEFES